MRDGVKDQSCSQNISPSSDWSQLRYVCRWSRQKGWQFFCVQDLSKYTFPFSFWEISRPPNVVFLLCSISKMFICYGFRTCANDTFGSKFQAWAGLEVVCGPETLSMGQRSLGFTFVHHCTATWEKAGLGWIPQRWVTFMFYIIHIHKKMPVGLDQCHLPWKAPRKLAWLSMGRPCWILSLC